MFEYSYATTEGAVRKVNQDALMIKTARYKGREILFAAVCDGIGGLADGEKASSCVIGSVSDWFENVYPSLLRSGSGALDIRSSLDKRLHSINNDINKERVNGKVMGTTFTSLLIDTYLDTAMIAHVGDTRLYKIYDHTAEVVTMDHSVVGEEIRRGIITEESARFDKRQNQITNCIGAGARDRMYDYMLHKPETECVYLICSDGFRRQITKEEICGIMSPSRADDSEKMKAGLEYLMRLDIERSEEDNITALAVRYSD